MYQRLVDSVMEVSAGGMNKRALHEQHAPEMIKYHGGCKDVSRVLIHLNLCYLLYILYICTLYYVV